MCEKEISVIPKDVTLYLTFSKELLAGYMLMAYVFA
jgi:hypothetical protein